MHISKIRLLFPVSFTIEYKVGIAEIFLYMAFGADLSKNVVNRAWKLPKSESAHLWNRQTTSALSHKQQATKLPHLWTASKISWKSVKNCGRNRSTTDLFTNTQTDWQKGKNDLRVYPMHWIDNKEPTSILLTPRTTWPIMEKHDAIHKIGTT